MPEDCAVLEFADLSIDCRRQTVSRNGRALPIEGRTYQLFCLLVRRHPETVSHAEILATVWKGTVVGGHTLTQRVKLLRRALRTGGGHDYVVSVHGQGYRLAEPQPSVPAASASASRQRLGWWASALMLLAALFLALALFAPHALKHAVRHALM